MKELEPRLPITALPYAWEGDTMQVVHPVCCGLDVHQATLTACLRCMRDDGQITTEMREYGTTFRDLLALSDWLVEVSCPIVAMESTGVYVRRITARAISLAERTGAGGKPVGQRLTRQRKPKGTAACRRSGAAQKPCMVRLCQTRVLW
jgi:hypothetical protein